MADSDIAPIALRRCSRCRLWKPQNSEHFYCARKRGHWSSRCKPCAVEAAQERYFANPEPIRDYSNARYKANPERIKAQTARWAAENPDLVRAYSRASQKKAYAALRAEMLTAYGSRCACCGLSEHPNVFLTLEHTNRDGAAHRKRCGGQVGVLKELRRLGWPIDGYCLLCWNCQLSSWYGGACAHTPDYRPSQPKHRAHRDAVIAGYGGCCACCGLTEPVGLLCVEHMNQDGKAHRLATGGNVYRDLIKQGFPPGITILCYNCQMARAFHGACPHERGRQLTMPWHEGERVA